MPRVRAPHLALLVVGLLLVPGSAYAGQQLAKNTVGSPQVKNGSLLSKDLKNRSIRGVDLRTGAVTAREVRDGSLRRADLGATAVADTRVIIRTVEAASGGVTFFTDPKIGTLSFSCGGAQSISGFFSIPPTAVPAAANVSASDIADNSPVGGATVTAPEGSMGGGVGYGGGNHLLPEGHFFVTTRTATLHAAWTATGSSTCTFRVELTVDRTRPTGFFPRTAAKPLPARCSARTGAATCTVR